MIVTVPIDELTARQVGDDAILRWAFHLARRHVGDLELAHIDTVPDPERPLVRLYRFRA